MNVSMLSKSAVGSQFPAFALVDGAPDDWPLIIDEDVHLGLRRFGPEPRDSETWVTLESERAELRERMKRWMQHRELAKRGDFRLGELANGGGSTCVN